MLKPRDSARAAAKGVAAAFILGSLGSLLFSLVYILKRQYLPESLQHVGVYLAYYPISRVVPPVLAAGAAIGFLLNAAGRGRRIAVTILSILGCSAIGIVIHRRFGFAFPAALPFQVGVGGASVLVGACVFLVWAQIERVWGRLPVARVALAFAVPVAALALTVMVGHPADRMVPHTRYGERQFLALFDRKALGMDAVFAKADAGDMHGAMDTLAEHFRSRPLPPILEPLSAATPEQIEEAERGLRHLFSMTRFERQEGRQIDWTGGAVSDREYAYTINRHLAWREMGRAYLATGDDRYVDEIVGQLHDWIARTDPPRWKMEATSSSWRLLECALRLRDSWIPTAVALRSNPKLDTWFWGDFLGSIHDQAEFISFFRSDANHLLMESNGLLETALAFPEFKRARIWKEIALARIAQQLEAQIYPDGVHVELSPAYHRMVLQEFTRGLRVMELHRVVPPEGMAARLEHMWEYLAAVVRPDGQIPNLNDGAPADIREDLREAAAVFERPDLLYAATGGEEGAPPAWLSRLFPDAGQAIQRTGWGPQDLFLVLDAGAFGGPHGHEDKLSIVCSAYGRPLIVDPGSFTYDTSNFWRRFFASSYGHNTVLVDGLGQVRQRLRSSYKYVPAPRPFWAANDVAEYAEGTYEEGYADPGDWEMPIDRSVRHIRGVLFLKPDYWVVLDRLEGEGRHSHTRLFHVAPGEVALDSGGARTAFPDGGNLAVLPVEKAGAVRMRVVRGWYSRGYNAREPAPILAVDGSSELPCGMATILYPYPAGQSWSAEPEETALPGGGIALRIVRSGGEDLVVWPAIEGGEWSYMGLTGAASARLVLVRRDLGGRETSMICGKGPVLLDGRPL